MPSKPRYQPTPSRDSPVSSGEDNQNVIYPRRKAGQSKKSGGKAGVVVTLEVLEQVFDLPLHRACKTLGVCATAFKKVCRKLGVMKWPYKDNHLPPKRKAANRRRQLAQERAQAAAAARAAAKAVAEAAHSDAPTEVAEPEAQTPRAVHAKAPVDEMMATQDVSVEDEKDGKESEDDEDAGNEKEGKGLVSPGYTASSEGDEEDEMCDVASPEDMFGLYNEEDAENLVEEEPMNFFAPSIEAPLQQCDKGARREVVEFAGFAYEEHAGLDELFPMKDAWQSATAPSMVEILGC